VKTPVLTAQAPQPIGPYSQAIRHGDTIYVAGQIPVDPATGKLVAGGIEEQTARVLDSVKAILLAAGVRMDDVLSTTVYLADLGDFARMNGVYATYFTTAPPARATVQVAALPLGAAVEIAVVAGR
jgi:2-iminobutanoate/2-iminopropanoate deaminase